MRWRHAAGKHDNDNTLKVEIFQASCTFTVQQIENRSQ
jgi:hypothetical protein